MLIVGIVVLVVGISDFMIAGVLMRQNAGASGLGNTDPPAVVRILRRSGMVTVAAGIVLVVIGLLG